MAHISVFTTSIPGKIVVSGYVTKSKHVLVPIARAKSIANRLWDLGYTFKPFLGGGLGYTATKLEEK